MPASRTSTTTRTLAAERDDGWILRSEAVSRFGLKGKDLDLINPIERRPNIAGRRGYICKYNLSEVEELAARLQSGACIAALQGLAKPKGPKIMRTRAMKEFNLTAAQMDTIRPISIQPNPHNNQHAPMRFYNRCDVKALKDRLGV